MKNPNERLKEARSVHYDTAREAADALGVNRQTYSGHENGADGFPISAAIKYARKFKTSLDWLLAGKGKGPEKRTAQVRPDWQDDLEASLEFAVSEGAGAGEISAFTTEALLTANSEPKPVKDPEPALRAALIAYGVDRRALKTVMSFINDNRLRQSDEKSQQDRSRDQSEPSNRRHAATPSR